MNIHLRRATPDDAEHFARINAAHAVYANLLQVPHPGVERWKKRLAEDTEDKLVLLAELDGEVVGHAGVFCDGGRVRQRHTWRMGIGIAQHAWGKGVGTALMTELMRYADDWAQALRIELHVFTDNARAIALYRKFGFEIEGTLRGDSFRDGQYVSSHLMARLHPRLVAELARNAQA